MNSRSLLSCLTIVFLVHVVLARQPERQTHAIINGEVRGNGTLPNGDKNAYLMIELRLSRDDRPRSIARTRIKLYSNKTVQSFTFPFKLRYPLAKISPHNAYILSARIRNGQNKLIYVGDLPVPVTEQKEKQARHLVINLVETRGCRTNERTHF